MFKYLKTLTKVQPIRPFHLQPCRNLATIIENGIPPSPTTELTSTGYLQLQSGEIFPGKNFGSKNSSSGEAVFTTSPVGYPESMTDPSYKGQILIFTQPLIGNYGVPDSSVDQFGLLQNFESNKIQVNGIVVNDYALKYSHWSAVESLSQWCTRNQVPALSGIDTRQLTQLLRDRGTTLANLYTSPSEMQSESNDKVFYDPSQFNLVDQVSTKQKYSLGDGNLHLAVIDCGVKHNILRYLLQQSHPNHKIKLTVLPWDYDFTTELYLYDGIFISNGPGNPNHCTSLINNLKYTLQEGAFEKPIFGICMGNQILGKALDLNVYKMQFGNRGHNQPAINQLNNRCYITSQNHGYALDTSNLPTDWSPYFVNANDHSNEGLIHKFKPISSVQFHPEAKGGPTDTTFLFKNFIQQVVQCKEKDNLKWKNLTTKAKLLAKEL